MATKIDALRGRVVALDVQHLYRDHKPFDHGARFRFPGGLHVTEAELAVGYARIAAELLTNAGARVILNDPARRVLVGYYSSRHREAARYGAELYVACHVNAGRGRYGCVALLGTPAADAAAGPFAAALARELGKMRPPIAARVRRLGWLDRGRVCLGSAVPCSVLLEPFFGDNPEHLATYGSASGMREVAGAILRGCAAELARRPRP